MEFILIPDYFWSWNFSEQHLILAKGINLNLIFPFDRSLIGLGKQIEKCIFQKIKDMKMEPESLCSMKH